MQSFINNLKHFNQKTLQLITSSNLNQQQQFPQIVDQNQFNIQPISFASNTPNQFQNDYNPLNNDSQLYQHFQLPDQSQSQLIAEIHNLQLFQQTILDHQITIIVQANHKKDKLHFPHYFYKSKNNKIIIYQNKKKICQLTVNNQKWTETQQIVLNVLQSLQKSQNNFNTQPNYEQSNQQSNQAKFFATQPQFDQIQYQIKPYHTKQKRKTSRNKQKRQSKKQSKRQSNQQTKRDSKQRIKCPFQKQKIQQRKYEYFPKKESRSQRSQQPQRYDIPIIIRKSNNQIQKVTASYPLSHQQMQAINSLLELEIQGLFTDQQINKVKMMVLGQNDAILKIFADYSKQKMNIGELSNSLAYIIRRKDSFKK